MANISNNLNTTTNMIGDYDLNHAQVHFNARLLDAFKENSNAPLLMSRVISTTTPKIINNRPSGVGTSATCIMQRRPRANLNINPLQRFGGDNSDKLITLRRTNYSYSLSQYGGGITIEEVSASLEYNAVEDFMSQLPWKLAMEKYLLLLQAIITDSAKLFATNSKTNTPITKPSEIDADCYLQFTDLQKIRRSFEGQKRTMNGQNVTVHYPKSDIDTLLDKTKNEVLITNSQYFGGGVEQFTGRTIKTQNGFEFESLDTTLVVPKGVTGFLGDPAALKVNVGVTLVIANSQSILQATRPNSFYLNQKMPNTRAETSDIFAQFGFVTYKHEFGARVLDKQSVVSLIHATEQTPTRAAEFALRDNRRFFFHGDDAKDHSTVREIKITDPSSESIKDWAVGIDVDFDLSQPEDPDNSSIKYGSKILANTTQTVALYVFNKDKGSYVGAGFLSGTGIAPSDVRNMGMRKFSESTFKAVDPTDTVGAYTMNLRLFSEALESKEVAAGDKIVIVAKVLPTNSAQIETLKAHYAGGKPLYNNNPDLVPYIDYEYLGAGYAVGISSEITLTA